MAVPVHTRPHIQATKSNVSMCLQVHIMKNGTKSPSICSCHVIVQQLTLPGNSSSLSVEYVLHTYPPFILNSRLSSSSNPSKIYVSRWAYFFKAPVAPKHNIQLPRSRPRCGSIVSISSDFDRMNRNTTTSHTGDPFYLVKY